MSNQEPEIAEKERLSSSLHLKEVAEESVVLAPEADDHTSQITPPDAPAALETKTYPESPPELGERYEILDYIGAGGMGTVWKVLDKTLNETFAIKVLRPQFATDEDSIKRIKQEARLAMDLTHANIAAVFGATEDVHGQPCIIMRYAEGESLQNILAKEGKLDPVRAEQIYNQIADALVHSHMKGIVHRDIKPSNIIISRTASGGEVVKLVDFGIAKSVYEEVSKTQALTKTSDVVGSPRYMSPEQFLGQEVGPPADWYSLGCVYYEMLTGHPPFTEENPVKLILQHLHDQPDFSKVPKQRVFEISVLLQKDPKQRKRITDSIRSNAWIPSGLSLDVFNSISGNALISAYAAGFIFISILVIFTMFVTVPTLVALSLSVLHVFLFAFPIFTIRWHLRTKQVTPFNQKLLDAATVAVTFTAFHLFYLIIFGPIHIWPAMGKSAYFQFLLPPLVVFAAVLVDKSRKLISRHSVKLLAGAMVIVACVTLGTFSAQDIEAVFLRNSLHSLPEKQHLIDVSKDSSLQETLMAQIEQLSNYSGQSTESEAKWQTQIEQALGTLTIWIRTKENPKPYISSIPVKQLQIDCALWITRACIAHRQPGWAYYAMNLKSENYLYESGPQIQQSIILYNQISDLKKQQNAK